MTKTPFSGEGRSPDATHKKLVRKYGGTVVVGGRRYRRFIPFPKPINDDTLRCIRCGQIDEESIHILQACIEAME